MVVYEAPSGTISLLVESSKAAVVAGGDRVITERSCCTLETKAGSK
jgi:hypothetical protein